MRVWLRKWGYHINMNGHHGVATNIRALKISAVLTFAFFFVEIIVALLTGSLSLLADAGHELSTVVAISISLIAGRLALSKPTSKRTYGLLRAETVAAFINGLLLLGMALFIIVNGINRLSSPVEMDAAPMLAVALGGIGLDIASLLILYKGQKGNLNMRGSFWHVMNDFLGTLAVIIAALFIQFGQIYSVDTWAGLIFAIILIYAAYGIIKDSLMILVDAAPTEIDLAKVEQELSTIPGVIGTHHFHARTISSHILTFSGHLVVKDISTSGDILKKAKQILDKKYKFALSDIQIEPENLQESDIDELEYRKREVKKNHEL